MPINGFKNFKACEDSITKDLIKRKKMSSEKARKSAKRICGAKEAETQNSKFTKEDYEKIGEYVIEMRDFENGVFPSGKYPFNLLGHYIGQKASYDLQVDIGDNIKTLTFMSSVPLESEIKTMQDAKKCICKERLSRLYSEFSMPEDRDKSWMKIEGVTKEPEFEDKKGVYHIITSGDVEIESNSSDYAKLEFKSEILNGSYVLRTMQNIKEKTGIDGEQVYILWKPEQKIPTQNSSIKKLETLNSTFDHKITKHPNSNTFTTIMMAEGRWIDRFGNVVLYTPEFIEHAYHKLVTLGSIPVDKHHSRVDNGAMTKFYLKKSPITHIVADGYYNGDTSDVVGSSIDATLSIYGDPSVGAIPVDVDFNRNSLVSNPACSVCLNL